MAHNKTLSSHFATLIFTASAFSHASAEVNSGALQPTYQDYQAGETWVWQYKGMTTEGIVRADGTDTKKIIADKGTLYMQTMHKRVPLTKIVAPETSPTPRYLWPLTVGKTWQFEQHWTSEDGTQGATIQTAVVEDYQPKTVRAGTFMAYTIRYTGKITDSKGFSADTTDIHWYAPKLKTFIKLTQIQGDYQYNEELIHYQAN